jgi:dihydrofolate reductase
MAATDAYLFGRKTYEKMAAFWPNAPADDPYAQHLNSTPKYVASRTLDRLDWEGSQLLEGDASEAVARLKQQPGGHIVVLGSGELAQTLMEHDLVDEYELVVFPLLLGGGKRLFRDNAEVRRLQLVDSKPTTTGGLILTYRPA